jgi:DNA/RNA endonuclease G (NUC1)
LVFGRAENNSYSLKLNSGQSITHNRFLVPDWGALRFDLYRPSLTGGRVSVTLEAVDDSGSFSSWVNLTAAVGTASEYLADTQRIGYGTTGFETFTVDVPDRFRGKTATLRFEASGGTVYLDNVFFKSQHLILGNPTRNGQIALPEDTQTNNYLLEKPQYAVSYNNETKNPNWVSWKIDGSWIGNDTNSVSRRSLRLTDLPDNYPPNTDFSASSGDEPWISDPSLPTANFPVKVEGEDLNNAVSSGSLQRGHLSAFRDRDRNAKDAIATFLTTNLIPQNTENNINNTAWAKFENYIENTLVSQGREVYVIAGGYYDTNRVNPRLVANNTVVNANGDFVLDSNNRITTGTLESIDAGQSISTRTNPKLISVPDFTWKIAVVLNPGQQLADISSNTQVIAIITPNRNTPPDSSGSIQLPN